MSKLEILLSVIIVFFFFVYQGFKKRYGVEYIRRIFFPHAEFNLNTYIDLFEVGIGLKEV